MKTPQSRQKIAAENMSAVQKIHRALRSGPPSNELRTAAESVTSARVLFREIQNSMLAKGLQPEQGDWAVHVAYVSTDLSLTFTQQYVPGSEPDLLKHLTDQPVILIGLIFAMRDKDAQGALVVGVKPFLDTKQTSAWLREKADELILEDCRVNWRAAARAEAESEAEEKGLRGQKAQEFIRERTEYHYSKWERIGMENLL